MLNSSSKYNSRRFITSLIPYLYIAPALIFFALFLAYPVYFSLRLSVHEWNGMTGIEGMRYIGVANFEELKSDRLFWLSMKNTVLFAIVTTVAQMTISFLLAFALWYFRLPLKKTIRAVIFFPSIVSIVILGLIWREMLSSEGLVNALLGVVAGKDVSIQWFGNPKLVLWTIMAIDIWIFTGTNMILWLAGMMSIPSDLLDAARIDGANVWQIVRHVVAPLLEHVFALSLLINFIGGFQAFAIVYVTTRGGPAHLSEMLATYVFWNAFYSLGPQRFGYASAIATVMIVILLVFSYTRIKMGKVL